MKSLKEKIDFFKSIIITLIRLTYRYPEDIVFLNSWFLTILKKKEAFEDIPWLNFKTIRFLKKYLKKDMKIFEYGSGGSTLFFAERTKEVISVEHDREFYKNLQRKIKEKNYNNINYILKEPEISINTSIIFYSSFSDSYKGMSFEKYVRVIEEFPDNYFDIVLIDGRARNGCMKFAYRKVKKYGLIILDNAERKRYKTGIKNYLTGLKIIRFYGIGPFETIPWETDIFIKREIYGN